jgi:OmpA-OmpF porin, OOP family
MVKGQWSRFALAVCAAAIIGGCASQGAPPPVFEARPVAAGHWQQKVDNLYFILDASSSMGQGFKLETARGIIAHFNATMPPLRVMVALRSFGHDQKVSTRLSDLMVEPQAYDPGLLTNGLAKVSKAGGISPLDRALEDAATDLEPLKGSIALLIVSDGKDMGDAPLAAAKALKTALADRLCIYTVVVGDAPDGQKLLSRIAQIGGCGLAVTAGSLATGGNMNAFVHRVLLAGMADSDGDGVVDDQDRCPGTSRGVKVDAVGCPLDSDRDGVPDDQDQCPQTPEGVKVDARGCPVPVATLGTVTAAGTYVFKDIQFENNKSDLKAGSYPTLNEIAEALKARPDLRVEIQGHTDSRGNHDYNVGLSQRRAESVKAYLVSRGIDGARLTPRGYGPDRPIATNDTARGRANNRRVEFKPVK